MKSQDVLRNISLCYASVGSQVIEVESKFSAYYFQEWKNPVMTLFLPKDYLCKKNDLDVLEAYFKAKTPTHGNEPERFYFNALFASDEAFYKDKCLKNYNALKLHTKKINYITYLNRPIERKHPLPKELKAIYGDYFDSRIHEKMRNVCGKVFSSSLERLDRIDAGVRKSFSPKTVVFEDQHEKPVAAGAVFTKGSHSYLFSGAVCETWRNKGLWQHLVYERQKLSQKLGAKHWTYSSSNEWIKSKGDISLENICISKDKL